MNPELLDTLHTKLTADNAPPLTDAAAVANLIRAEAGIISDHEVLATLTHLRTHATGLGPLEPLLTTPGLTDILVNGPHNTHIVTTTNPHPTPTTTHFPNDQAVRQLATRLAHSCGTRLDDAHPYADGRILRDDGTRIRFHAILSPPSDNGTCISLRILHTAHTTLEDLHNNGTITTDIKHLLTDTLTARKNFLITGGTGSGKTTLLSALLAHTDPHHRILIIEDTPELAPQHPHTLTLTSRGANTDGHGAITMSTLLQQALRMRPDRIIVGEIRGKEIADLLAALNTGHAGGGGTIHANSINDIPARIEALASLAGMPRPAAHSHMAAAIDLTITLTNRTLTHIGTLTHNPTTGLCTTTPLWHHRDGPTPHWNTYKKTLT